MAHVLKIQASPDDTAVNRWKTEMAAFQDDAQLRFTPSMQQRIDLAMLYGKAIGRSRIADSDTPPPVARGEPVCPGPVAERGSGRSSAGASRRKSNLTPEPRWFPSP